MEHIINELKFGDNGLIPAIIQDYKTDEVLMMAYMNAEAFQKTIDTGKAHYYSRSRQKLWLKGETSGHFQFVKSVSIDCDNDTLLLKVEQVEAACHTGHYSCFHRKLEADSLKTVSQPVFDAKEVYLQTEVVKETAGPEILQEVYDVIVDRTVNPKEGSYTNYLLGKGLDKILKKVGEECAEVIIASKNTSANEIKYEISDLLYHLFVLMVERKVTLEDIYNELKGRR